MAEPVCDYAACHEPGAVRDGEWLFCVWHHLENLSEDEDLWTPQQAEDAYQAVAHSLSTPMWTPTLPVDTTTAEDAKIRRCRCCGEWAWDTQPCSVCTTPAAVAQAVS